MNGLLLQLQQLPATSVGTEGGILESGAEASLGRGMWEPEWELGEGTSAAGLFLLHPTWCRAGGEFLLSCTGLRPSQGRNTRRIRQWRTSRSVGRLMIIHSWSPNHSVLSVSQAQDQTGRIEWNDWQLLPLGGPKSRDPRRSCLLPSVLELRIQLCLGFFTYFWITRSVFSQ